MPPGTTPYLVESIYWKNIKGFPREDKHNSPEEAALVQDPEDRVGHAQWQHR